MALLEQTWPPRNHTHAPRTTPAHESHFRGVGKTKTLISFPNREEKTKGENKKNPPPSPPCPRGPAVAWGSALDFPPGRTSTSRSGPRGSIQFGAFRPGLVSWGAAYAAVGTVTLHDIAIEFGGVSSPSPTAVFTGLNLSQADLAALFDKNAAEPLAARLARVSAQQVAIPELTVSQRVGEETRRTVYRDVTARDIVNGRIASLATPARPSR